MELATDSTDTWIITALLEEVKHEWLNVSDELRPFSAWICNYAVLDESGNPPRPFDPPLRAWHLDKAGTHARDVQSFLRFTAVKIDRLWGRSSMNPMAIDTTFGRRHEIGVAKFGCLAASTDWYLGYHWGIRHGRGFRYTFDHDRRRLNGRQDIWVS